MQGTPRSRRGRRGGSWVGVGRGEGEKGDRQPPRLPGCGCCWRCVKACCPQRPHGRGQRQTPPPEGVNGSKPEPAVCEAATYPRRRGPRGASRSDGRAANRVVGHGPGRKLAKKTRHLRTHLVPLRRSKAHVSFAHGPKEARRCHLRSRRISRPNEKGRGDACNVCICTWYLPGS